MELTKDALVRDLDFVDKLGSLDTQGLAAMRKGKMPTVQRGPHKVDQLNVDHIVPRSVCPELDNVIANLDLKSRRVAGFSFRFCLLRISPYISPGKSTLAVGRNRSSLFAQPGP